MVLPKSACARYVYSHVLFPQTRQRISKHASQTKWRTHTGAETHTCTHTPARRAEPLLCWWVSERVQQGPLVLSWSPPVWPRATLCSQAAHHSLHTANRLSTWRESWLLPQRHQPTCDSSSLTSFFTASAGATTGIDTGAILASDRYRVQISCFNQMCLLLHSPSPLVYMKGKYCKPEASFLWNLSWWGCRLPARRMANLTFSVQWLIEAQSVDYRWLRVVSKQMWSKTGSGEAFWPHRTAEGVLWLFHAEGELCCR